MEFNLFQLLILLLLFYPLIRRVLDGLKGDQGETEETEATDDPWASSRKQKPAQDRQTSPSEMATHTGKTTRSTQYGSGSTSRTGRDAPRASQQNPYRESHQGDRPGSRSTSRSGQDQSEPQSWEDFFEGLEQVLSGEEKETRTSDSHRHPSHGPVYTSRKSTDRETQPADEQTHRRKEASRDPYTYKTGEESEHMKNAGKSGEEMTRELAESDSPIFSAMEDSPQVISTRSGGQQNVKRILGNPSKLRDGILLKIILDPPKSRRPVRDRS